MPRRARKAPCVDLKTDALKDQRFEVLGELAGYNKFEALGRMFALWAWCIDRGPKDAPDDSDGYVVSDAVVARFLGPRGVTAILGDECDEFALGTRREDGKIYLRGTSEYVEAMRARIASSTAGGNARSEATRDPTGRFVSDHTITPADSHPPSSRPPAGQPAVDHPTPAPSSSPSSSSSPSEITELSLRARAIVPSTVPGTELVAARQLEPRERGRLAESIWARLSGLRVQIAKELGLSALPLPASGPSCGSPAFRELQSRIREEGDQAPVVCDRVVEQLVAQARDTKSIEWLSEKAFTEGGWRHSREAIPGWRAPARAGPKAAIGPASPRSDHPEATNLVSIRDLLS